MSQIVEYDSEDLEMLSLYARHLAPLLREKAPDQDIIDLSSVELSHFRLSKIKEQDLKMVKEGGEGGLEPGTDIGGGKAKSKEEEWLSQIIGRLNELFVTDGLTDKDLINYAYTIRDKMKENSAVMHQIANNSPAQALLGELPWRPRRCRHGEWRGSPEPDDAVPQQQGVAGGLPAGGL